MREAATIRPGSGREKGCAAWPTASPASRPRPRPRRRYTRPALADIAAAREQNGAGSERGSRRTGPHWQRAHRGRKTSLNSGSSSAAPNAGRRKAGYRQRSARGDDRAGDRQGGRKFARGGAGDPRRAKLPPENRKAPHSAARTGAGGKNRGGAGVDAKDRMDAGGTRRRDRARTAATGAAGPRTLQQ